MGGEAGAAEQEDNVRRLQERGYTAEWIAPERALEMEPAVDPAAMGDAAVRLVPG